jgi:two-component system, cell cycle response regulator
MICTVEALGFDVFEQKTLTATFALSVRREVAYAQWNAGHSKPPDLLLVDGDNPKAVEEMLSRKLDPRYPAVVVAANFPSKFPCVYVERPIRFLRLFKALDQALESKIDADKGEEDSVQPRAWASTMSMSSLDAIQPQSVVQQPASKPSALQVPDAIPLVAAALPVSNVVSLASSAERPARMRAADQASQVNSDADWVLVVDDNMAVRRFMAQKLQQFSINVDYAASGEQAIGLTGSKRYTCVFLDVVMPGMDGYQVCKLIKAGRASNDTRVVMLTSRSGTFDKIRGKMAGCDAYLTKPIDEEKLMNTIVRYLPEGAAMSDAMSRDSSMFLDSDAKRSQTSKI